MNFLSVTRRTELFFSKKWLKELKSLEHDSKNCFFFFLNVTQRIEFLSFCQKKKKRLKELSFSQKYDTKNWTSFQYVSKIFFNMTRRIEPFFITWFNRCDVSQVLRINTPPRTDAIWLLCVKEIPEPRPSWEQSAVDFLEMLVKIVRIQTCVLVHQFERVCIKRQIETAATDQTKWLLGLHWLCRFRL